MELMKDMLSDIEDFENIGVHIKGYFPDYIEIMINKDGWYMAPSGFFKLTEELHRIINRFIKYFKSLGYNIKMRHLFLNNFTASYFSPLLISDDEFLDDNHKSINNKEVLRIQIKLT